MKVCNGSTTACQLSITTANKWHSEDCQIGTNIIGQEDLPSKPSVASPIKALNKVLCF